MWIKRVESDPHSAGHVLITVDEWDGGFIISKKKERVYSGTGYGWRDVATGYDVSRNWQSFLAAAEWKWKRDQKVKEDSDG